MNMDSIVKLIDHTLLKPDVKKEFVEKLCEEAKTYKFASVCVNPYWVKYCYNLLKDTSVKVCTVIGFPLGASATKTKVFEAEQAIEDGATEIDMVINIGELKSGNYEVVKNDIEQVVKVCKEKALVKVIIETCLLNDEEKIITCKLAKEAGADFVKTSTGFSTGGASVHDILLMKKTVGDDMGIKASGGIRDLKTAIEMINAGATRIGTSSSVSIVSNLD